jgi:hypothetical protein
MRRRIRGVRSARASTWLGKRKRRTRSRATDEDDLILKNRHPSGGHPAKGRLTGSLAVTQFCPMASFLEASCWKRRSMAFIRW